MLAHLRSATACVLSRVIQHKLQSNLQLAATCVGLGSAQGRPSCVPRLAAASAGSGEVNERYRAHWSQMLLFGENLEKSEAWVKTSHSYGKAMETAWVVLKAGWSRTSGNHLGGANSMSQVDGVSDVELACWLCGDKALKRKNGLCQPFFLGKRCPPALALMLDNSVPPYMPLMPFIMLPHTELRRTESA